MTTSNDPVSNPTEGLITRLMDVLIDDILPLTEKSVLQGNKIFGAAMLRKSDFSTYLAETNNELESPLHHGEMHLLKRYFDIPEKQREPAAELIFLSTHEPCSMCLSAITWGGFDNFFYFFSHEDSRDEFAIPHDLLILKEVFNLEPGGYNKANAFWQCHSIASWIADLPPGPMQSGLIARTDAIQARYAIVSRQYQASKQHNSIPLN